MADCWDFLRDAAAAKDAYDIAREPGPPRLHWDNGLYRGYMGIIQGLMGDSGKETWKLL